MTATSITNVPPIFKPANKIKCDSVSYKLAVTAINMVTIEAAHKTPVGKGRGLTQHKEMSGVLPPQHIDLYFVQNLLALICHLGGSHLCGGKNCQSLITLEVKVTFDKMKGEVKGK